VAANAAVNSGFEVIVNPGECGGVGMAGGGPLLTDRLVVAVIVMAIGTGCLGGYICCRVHTGGYIIKVRCTGFQYIYCAVFMVAARAVSGSSAMACIAIGSIKMLAGMSGLGHSQHLRRVAVAGCTGQTGDIKCTVVVGCSVEVGVGVAVGTVW
jgi:hypothetical protein